MLYARALGRAVKLLGMAELVDGKGWRASVAPAMVAEAHPLANVSDVFNAVMVHGDRVDDVMFYGRGAGTARRRARCAGTYWTSCAARSSAGACRTGAVLRRCRRLSGSCGCLCACVRL